MKKLIVTLMIVAMMFAVTGCSKSGESNSEKLEVSSPETTSEITEGDVGGAVLFGKVKNVVGNEIEIELADLPFDDGIDDGEKSDNVEMKEFVYEVEEGEALPDGIEPESHDVSGTSDMSSSTVIIATQGADGQMHVIGGDSGEKMDLTYTGESKSIIIPAGINIMNMIGATTTLEDIKKGSVLMLSVDDEKADSPKATQVTIME